MAAKASPASLPPLCTKESCRAGLTPAARAHVWFALATACSPAPGAAGSSPSFHTASGVITDAQKRLYMSALREVFGNVDTLPSKTFRIPFLGVEPSVLPEEATLLISQPTIAMSAAHDRIICVLAQLHSLRYSPQVANLALILLRFCGEAHVFTMLHTMLGANAATHMLLLSHREEAAFVKTFRTLIKSYFPKLSEHLESMGGAMRAIFAAWFRGFFAGYLPPDDVHRIVDSYLYEGPKVLIRYGLALLKCVKRKLKACSSAAEVDVALRRYVGRFVLVNMHTAVGVARLTASAPTDATVAAVAAAVGMDAHLVRAILATGHDASIPTPYTFEHLRSTAFTGVQNLSRGTIESLMARYLGSATTAAPRAATAAEDAIPTAARAAASDVVMTGSDATAHTTRSESSEAPIMSRVVLPRQNAVVTIPAAPASSTVTDIERKHGGGGVAYAAAAEDDGSALPAWTSAKIIGIGTRLMSDFAAQDAAALRSRMHASLVRAATATYKAAAGATTAEDGTHDATVDAAAAAAAAQQTRAEYAVASSPHLASLSTLLPERVGMLHWTCMYSTDTHGWSLHTLYQRTAGFAPCFLVLQARLKSAVREDDAPPPSSGGTSKLMTAMSSKRPVFGLYSTHGLSVASVARSGSGGWTGSADDFMFQLFPEMNVFAASAAEVVSRTGEGEESYKDSFTGRDLYGDAHRTRLHRSRFLLCAPDALCVGGDVSRTGVQTLYIPDTLQSARASRALLTDMSVPGLPPVSHDDAAGIELDILALEVYAFVDRGGQFQANVHPGALAAVGDGDALSLMGKAVDVPGVAAAEITRAVAHAQARKAYQRTLETWWTGAAGGGR